MPTLSHTYDITSLIEHYASIQTVGRPTRVYGVLEVHSNCPFCGGTDRFITRPETGQFSCAIRSSGCGRSGDGIDFLKEFMNMSHSEACEVLALENVQYNDAKPVHQIPNSQEHPPSEEWQHTGKLLIDRAVSALWSSAGKEMLDYLRNRGLRDETIKKKKFGYIPLQGNGKFYESSLESWGLDIANCPKDKVRIPNGILIPWFDGSTLWRLALKRPDQPKGKDYGQVLGSGEGLYGVSGIQYDFPAMVVESEFCQSSVEQEAGDLIACVATGSTTRGRLNKWIAELGLPSAEKNGFVLQSFDEDDSGDVGAEYWIQNLKKCMRWSPYIAKDPNDILRKKYFDGSARLTLREWVELGIENAKVEFGLSRPFVLPPQVGGGLQACPLSPLQGG